MNSDYKNHFNYLHIFTPFPPFPHGGRSTAQSISPLGETGKGVI
jgi:hypothetical protein